MSKELIERLRNTARHDSVFGNDVREHASEQAADAIEALQAEVEWLTRCIGEFEGVARTNIELMSERDKLRAQIEASRKQEPVTKVETCANLYITKRFSILGFTNSPINIDTPLYAAPLAPEDVQRDAERYRYAMNWSTKDFAVCFNDNGSWAAVKNNGPIDAAMKGAAA
jgi:hypothetical protein